MTGDLPAAAHLRRRTRTAPVPEPVSATADSVPAEQATPRSVDRARVIACCVGLVALIFAQSSTLIVGDTKLDLVVDPVRFMARSLHLWDPSASFGQLQDQAYGYLFPMGPFFALGKALALPAWGIQRAWQASMLVAAFLGMRKLAERLGIGTPNTRILGGLLFALSPLIMTELGPLSAEAVTECLAPWVLIPLIGQHALERPRRAAARSGAAILLAGGINAAATIALLVLPALWLLTQPAGPDRRRLTRWCVVAVVLATAWWAGPLVILGHYSPPFTDWIESSSITTSTTSLLNVLSGTENWVGHLTTIAGPTWRAAWQLETNRTAIVHEALAAAIGLVGLTRRDLPHRRFFITAALLGLLILTMGHAGPLNPALSAPERRLLDGPLNAFRNIQKFDLVLRVPLAIGAIHAMTVFSTRLSKQWAHRTRQEFVRPIALLGAVVLLGLGLPLWSHQIEPAGGFSTMPSWWTQTASYLAKQGDSGRALLLPASSHGQYAWGEPQDEPLQALATTPWAVRSALPLGGAGEARLLDAVDQQIETGTGGAALEQFLARAGVGWLVVRNDLNPTASPVTQPAVVRAALQSTPGVTLAASFGPAIGDASTGPNVVSDGISVLTPSVEVYRVPGASPRISTMSVAGTQRVSGNVESLLTMADRGLLKPHTATIMAGQPAVPGVSTRAEPRIVTDGNRHAEATFSRVTDVYSSTLLPGQDWSTERAGHDYQLGNPEGHQTTADVYGASTLRASSSASDAAAIWLSSQADGPAAAFDGNPATTWVSGGATAVGQWVEEDFAAPQKPQTITLSTAAVSGIGPGATTVTVRTDAGSETVPVTQRAHTYRLPGRSGANQTTRVRVTIVAVQGGGDGFAATVEATVGSLLGPEVSLQTPADSSTTTGGAPSATPPVFVFAAEPQNSGCLRLAGPSQTVCSTRIASTSEDSGGIDRTFSLDQAAPYGVGITAAAVGGSALDAALATAGKGPRLSVSSREIASPEDGAAAMRDGDPATAWIAAPQDLKPTVTASLPTSRAVSGLRVVTGRGSDASAPTRVTVSVAGSGQSESATVGSGGVVTLARPLTGRNFTIGVSTSTPRANVLGSSPTLPVGVGELTLRFRNGTASRPVPASTPFVEPCGSGPLLQLDGEAINTRVTSTVGTVLSDGQTSVAPCGAVFPQTSRPDIVSLQIGQHRLRVAATTTMRPDAVELTPAAKQPVATPAPSVRITQWSSDQRRAVVGSGAASWLVMDENANAGWKATLGGHVLTPTVIDGWKQAWLLPAGNGGVVSISYPPDRPYRLVLLIGGLLALLGVVLALSPQRRRAVAADRPIGTWRGRLARVALVVALAAAPLIIGWTGWVCIGVALLAVLAGRRTAIGWPDWLGRAAAVAITAAGLLAALHPSVAGGSHNTAVALQLLCGFAVAALSVSLWWQEPAVDPAPAHGTTAPDAAGSAA